MIRSATRISLLVLMVSLPILTWYGKVSPDLFERIILMVTTAFFAVKGMEGSSQIK